jgi:hypothetical protein
MRSSHYNPQAEETDLSEFNFFKHLTDTEIGKLNYDKTCRK